MFAVLGISLGVGIIVCQIGQSANGGLARIEIGRTSFRNASNPSFLHSPISSLNYLVVVEYPLYYNMSAVMGLSPYGSDDDDESDMRHMYMLDWKPEVCGCGPMYYYYLSGWFIFVIYCPRAVS